MKDPDDKVRGYAISSRSCSVAFDILDGLDKVDVPSALRLAVEGSVAANLGLSVQACSRVSGGTQNRLFQLRTGEGPLLLLKLYAVDRWPRLETEYATLSALNTCQLARVPQALMRDAELSYADSFEPGASRSASQLTRANVETVAHSWPSSIAFAPTILPLP
jgi:hypothetical protein